MPHSVSLISTIAVGLGLALVFGFIAARLRLPALVGYLLAVAMQQVIDLWKAENPNVEVEGQFIAEDYDTKVQTQVAAGTFTVTPKPCLVGASVLSPTQVNAGNDGRLNRNVTITVTTTGVCNALSLIYTPSTVVVTKPLVGNSTSSSWSYTIGANDHVWTTGMKRIESVTPPARERTVKAPATNAPPRPGAGRRRTRMGLS